MRGGHAHEVSGALRASWRVRWLRGGLGVRHDVVSGGGLGRMLRQHADRLDGRSVHAAVLAFGLGAGQVTDEKAC